jgi:hypothetical protein
VGVYCFGRRGGYVFLEVLINRTSLVVGRVISITKDTPDITRAFLDSLSGHQHILHTEA